MHYLHKILVYIPDVIVEEETPEDEMPDRDQLLEMIRRHAENETEGFYPTVFDWRETETAGRWEDEYPVNVLLARDDPDRFTAELKQAVDWRDAEIKHCLDQLKSTVGTDLEKIAEGLRMGKGREEKDGFNYLTDFYLHSLSAHLHGEYRCDSYFYDTHEYTADLCPAAIERVREDPQKWALVLFDQHC